MVETKTITSDMVISYSNNAGLMEEGIREMLGVNEFNKTITYRRFDKDRDNVTGDFGIVGGDIEDFTTDRDAGEEDSESSLLGEGIKILLAIPLFFRTVASGLGTIGSAIGIPDIFMQWAVTSIIVIIVLMIATAFLRNRLQD